MRTRETTIGLLQKSAAKSADIIIAIDPDAEKNGVVTLQRESRNIIAQSLSFPDTLDYLRYTYSQAQTSGLTVRVIIEAGWLNKTHWHVGYNDSRQAAAAKGNAVGRNHETGRKLAEMCEYWKIPFEVIKPLPLKVGGVHLWRGKDGKITHEELMRQLAAKQVNHGIKRSNQEMRDACLIIISEL